MNFGLGGSEILGIAIALLGIAGVYWFRNNKNTLISRQMSLTCLSVGALIVFLALSMFTRVLGHIVIVMPGRSILEAEAFPPSLYYLIWFIGLGLIGFGSYQFNKTRQRGVIATNDSKTSNALDEIKKAKELLDSGAISQDEFDSIKNDKLEQ